MALGDTVETLQLGRKEKQDAEMQTDIRFHETRAEAYDNIGYNDDHEQPIPEKPPPSKLDVNNIKFQDENGIPAIKGDEKESSIITVYSPSNDISVTSKDKNIIDTTDDIVVKIQVNEEPVISRRLQIVLTIANCTMATIPIGFLYALGVLFVNIIDEFEATRAEASPILSIYTTLMFGLGGVFGPVINKFNGGYVCIISGFIAFAGCIISYFAPSVVILIISIGVLTAVGLSTPFLLPFVIVGEIFEEKKRGFMITIIGLAPGIGAVVFPYLTGVLSERFGWRGTILIYGGLVLNVIPIGLLNAFVKRTLNKSHPAAPKSLKDIFNPSLFRKIEFLVLVFCIFLLNTLFPTINLFFIDMIRDKGFDIATGSALLSINGFANIGGRLFSMAISPFIKISRMIQWTFFLLIVSVTISFYVVFNNYAYLLGTCIVYGFFWGMCIISFPAMLLDIAGQKRYANAIGYTNLIGGTSGLFGAPVAGYIKDTTGSYDYVYYGTTALGTLACVLLALTIFRKSRRRKSEMKKTEVDSTDL